MFLCRDRGLCLRPPPPLHQREVARHIPRATHRSGFPNVSLHMLTPLKRASVPSVQSSTTNRVHHCFSQSPQYIFGFSPYVCSGHIERVVRGVELGDNCGGWPGAPRTPPAASSGHTGMWPRPPDLDSSRFWARSLPGFYIRPKPPSSKNPM